jgi:alkylation response protein AidB-like acyl-CoA dehydrogenase
MQFLERERAALAKFLPGLDEALAGRPDLELEKPGSPGVAAFRESGGAGLLVPTAHGGSGASAVDALLVQRAIGARSPSLAVAVAMHHFSMASLIGLSETSQGFEWMLMEGVARSGKLMASGFSEGNPAASILHPTMTAEVTPDGLRVSGVKRPCSLARSMDLLTASVMVPDPDGGPGQLAVVMIPAESEGVTVSPFWGSFALAGAESDQVTIDRVLVPEELVIRTNVPQGQTLDQLQVIGFLWFELLISASYLGAASSLVERVLHDNRVSSRDRAALAVELEAAAASLESIALRMDAGQRDQDLLAYCLMVRYATQDAIVRASGRAIELLGGMNFITSDEVAYLAASVHALGFHPPARSRMSDQLVELMTGGLLKIA